MTGQLVIDYTFVSAAGGPISGQSNQTVSPTARHCCDISSKGAVLLGRNDAEIGPANSLHASAEYFEYKEKFDFDLIKLELMTIEIVCIKEHQGSGRKQHN